MNNQCCKNCGWSLSTGYVGILSSWTTGSKKASSELRAQNDVETSRVILLLPPPPTIKSTLSKKWFHQMSWVWYTRCWVEKRNAWKIEVFLVLYDPGLIIWPCLPRHECFLVLFVPKPVQKSISLPSPKNISWLTKKPRLIHLATPMLHSKAEIALSLNGMLDDQPRQGEKKGVEDRFEQTVVHYNCFCDCFQL